MRLGTLLFALILAVAAWNIVRWQREPRSTGHQHEHPKGATRPEPSPVCPWRDPGRDLRLLFPLATNYVITPRILSGMTADIRRRLGRQMTPDENPLRIHRVLHDGTNDGAILVTRVKAEHGGIELVIGVKPDGAIQGVLLQSHREPAAAARTLTSSEFLASFQGKNAAAALELGKDLPPVPIEARASAQAIAEGVRAQLILLSFAESPEASGPAPSTRP